MIIAVFVGGFGTRFRWFGKAYFNRIAIITMKAIAENAMPINFNNSISSSSFDFSSIFEFSSIHGAKNETLVQIPGLPEKKLMKSMKNAKKSNTFFERD